MFIRLFCGRVANVVAKILGFQRDNVPLAGGLEDSVLQGLKMLKKTQEGSKKQSGELFFAGEPASVFPNNFLFFLNSLFTRLLTKNLKTKGTDFYTNISMV